MKLVEDAPKQQQQGPAPAVRLNGVNNGNGQVHNITHREQVNNKRDNCVHANKSALTLWMIQNNLTGQRSQQRSEQWA